MNRPRYVIIRGYVLSEGDAGLHGKGGGIHCWLFHIYVHVQDIKINIFYRAGNAAICIN